MHIAGAIVALVLPFLFVTESESKFSDGKSKQLLDAIRNTRLASGNSQVIMDTARKVKEDFENCRPRVCFAVDGSSSISASEYQLQINFVQIVAAVLGALDGSKFAAAQYGAIVRPISPLTDMLLIEDGFLNSVGKSTQVGASLTFIAPGLQFCVSDFAVVSGNSGNDKIVLLGDGRSTFGDDMQSPFGAVAIAKNFRDGAGNDICAGLVGGGQKGGERIFIGITGDKSKVVPIPSWYGISSSLMAIVSAICTQKTHQVVPFPW